MSEDVTKVLPVSEMLEERVFFSIFRSSLPVRLQRGGVDGGSTDRALNALLFWDRRLLRSRLRSSASGEMRGIPIRKGYRAMRKRSVPRLEKMSLEGLIVAAYFSQRGVLPYDIRQGVEAGVGPGCVSVDVFVDRAAFSHLGMV